jgi:ABC-type transport system substrate-binding protein
MIFSSHKRLQHYFKASLQASLGLWATTASVLFGQQQSSESYRLQQDRNLSQVVVIGMLTGKNEYTNTKIRFRNTEYLVNPTENSKPFRILNFSQNWIEVKLNNSLTNNSVTQIAYRYFSSERSLYQALLLNQVDFAILSDEALANEVSQNNSSLIPAAIGKQSHTVELIVYNLQHNILKNLEVRQAISYAIRRKQLIEQVIDGVPQKKGEIAKGSVYEPDHELYPDTGIEEYRYNLRKARDLLEAAGWIDVDNDGVREKKGQKLKINLAYRGGIEFEERIARDILLFCNRIGIEIIGVALSDKMLKKNQATQNFEAILLEHTFGENIDAIYDYFTNSKTSFIKFRNKAYEKLYKLAKQSRNEKSIIALNQGMQRILNRQSAVTFLFFKWYDYAIINSTKIKNVIDPATRQINPVDKWQFIQRGK